jgi:hypothetical protein
MKLKMNEVERKIKARGDKIIGSTYRGSKKYLLLTCYKNHKTWEATNNQILNDIGTCPECRKIAAKEKILQEHLSKVKKIVKKKRGSILRHRVIQKYNQNLPEFDVKCDKEDHLFWTTTLQNLDKKYWCKECAKEKSKIDPKIVEKEIIKRDGTLLKDEMINGVRFVTIKCNKDGNVWTTRLSSIRNGSKTWCRVCSELGMIRTVSPKIVEETIKNKGFILKSSPNINFWDEVDLHCPKHQHNWTTQFGHLEREGSNCKYCGSDAHDLNELISFLTANKVTFIERIPGKNNVQNIRVRCETHNHIWKSNAADLLKCDRWCYDCKWEERKTSYEIIKAIVEGNQGTLLTENCVGSLTKIQVKCENNHEFPTYYDNINQGYWCPLCPNKSQTQLAKVLQEIFPNNPQKYNFRGFDWLKDKRKLEIDIWLSDLKLAIEYDGEQHFRPVKFAKSITDSEAMESFKELKSRDAIKNTLIAKHPEAISHFIRIPYTEPITTENITRILKENKIKI